MPLRLVTRRQTGAITISGTIRLSSGARIRIQQRARSDDPKLAEEEARILEAEILRTDWHGGERRGSKSFAAAVLALPPRVVAALANLPHRDGPVFRRPDGKPYEDRRGRYGGQIKTAFAATVRRAGLNPELTPHACRHSWASWHYARHKDPLKLKADGGWSSLDLVERYAHLMPDGHEEAILRFLGLRDHAVTAVSSG